MTDTAEHVDALQALGDYQDAVQHAPLELRSAEVVDVHPSTRTVEIIVAPYEQPTPILRGGQWITETIGRGAFDGVERRANRVKVNRDHDVARTCGRAVALHPSRDEGLVGELRISQTPLGDETLALCQDRVLDASVGFAPMLNGERWTEHRSQRRIERAWLGHIALVPDPAYEGANVLDVRSLSAFPSPFGTVGVAHGTLLGNVARDPGAPVGTPLKDQVLARLRELGYPRTC